MSGGVDRILLDRVRSICVQMDLSLVEISDLFQLTPQKTRSLLSGKTVLSFYSLHQFCESVDLNIDRLIDGNFNVKDLENRKRAAVNYFPERYIHPHRQLVRARTVMGVVKYIEKLHGREYAARLLRRMHLSSIHFYDPDQMIDAFIISDLLRELQLAHFDPVHFVEMGKHALAVNQGTQIGKILSMSQSPYELYNTLHDQLIEKHYDKLFLYSLKKISRDGLTLKISTQKQGHEQIGVNLFGNRLGCLYRQGVYGSFISHIGHQFPKILESQCLYMGGTHCEYHVQWDSRFTPQPDRVSLD